MSESAPGYAGTVDDATLSSALEDALRERFGTPSRIAHLARRPSPYASSFRLEELDVVLQDGRHLALMFKDVSPHAWVDAARGVKPGALYDRRREIEVYRTILPTSPAGPPACYGAVADDAAGRYWLFLEKVEGALLREVGDFTVWARAARWLAALHARHGAARAWRGSRHLLHRDVAFYRRWRQRAESLLRAQAGPGIRDFAAVARCYDRVVERLASLPTTFVHGDFYASNVITQANGDDVRVCAVDWEMAGGGPGLLDVAALTSGGWRSDEREALTEAYHGALRAAGADVADYAQVLVDLDGCRLHLAMQWLGWAPAWAPPPEHAHDWMGEALRAVESLESAR